MFELSAGRHEASGLLHGPPTADQSQEHYEMLGYAAEKLLSMSILDITHPTDLAENREPFGQAVCGVIDDYSLCKLRAPCNRLGLDNVSQQGAGHCEQMRLEKRGLPLRNLKPLDLPSVLVLAHQPLGLLRLAAVSP